MKFGTGPFNIRHGDQESERICGTEKPFKILAQHGEPGDVRGLFSRRPSLNCIQKSTCSTFFVGCYINQW